jgi:uncharacterized membrane protein
MILYGYRKITSWRMKKLTLDIVWYFFIYAFLGWCTEVVYATSITGNFINRGFLNGPYCPIYGIGVIIVIYLLDPVKDNIAYMFFGSIFITSSIELVGGYVLEKIFHQKWWDYSDKPLNIGGYICLKFSLTWGLACLLVVDRIQPLVSLFVKLIPDTVGKILLVCFTFMFAIDLIETVKAILKLNKNLEVLDEIALKIRETSDNIGENLANRTITMVKKKDDLEESFEAKKEIFQERKENLAADFSEMREARQTAASYRAQILSDLRKSYKEHMKVNHFGQKRLMKAFPKLKSVNHKEALEKLKKNILN